MKRIPLRKGKRQGQQQESLRDMLQLRWMKTMRKGFGKRQGLGHQEEGLLEKQL